MHLKENQKSISIIIQKKIEFSNNDNDLLRIFSAHIKFFMRNFCAMWSSFNFFRVNASRIWTKWLTRPKFICINDYIVVNKIN